MYVRARARLNEILKNPVIPHAQLVYGALSVSACLNEESRAAGGEDGLLANLPVKVLKNSTKRR